MNSEMFLELLMPHLDTRGRVLLAWTLGDFNAVKVALKEAIVAAPITEKMTVDELHDTLRVIPSIPVATGDFFMPLTVTHVTTHDDRENDINGGRVLYLGGKNSPNIAGAFGPSMFGLVTHQVRTTNVRFLVVDGLLKEFIGTVVPPPVAMLVRWSHRFAVGFGVLPAPEGVSVRD